jgi:Acyl-CoA dehydrogenase, C-terminal domain
VDNTALAVDGITIGGHAATTYLIGAAAAVGTPPAASPDAAATARVSIAAVEVEAAGGFDPDLGVQHVRGQVPLSGVDMTDDLDRWMTAVGLAQRALGHELIGVAEGALATALAHVTERQQFGRPIGTFQAVKHRLADVQVAITAARKALDVAWELDVPFPSTVAKALCGQAALLAAKHCQQVCGGIGFTWEFGLHRYVRRAYLLDSIFGPAQAQELEIGRQLIATCSVPRLAQF